MRPPDEREHAERFPCPESIERRLIRHHVAVVCAALLALLARCRAGRGSGQRCQAPPGRVRHRAVLRVAARSRRASRAAAAVIARVDGTARDDCAPRGDEGEALLGPARAAGAGRRLRRSGASGGSAAAPGRATAERRRDASASAPPERRRRRGRALGQRPLGTRSSVEDGPTVGDAFAWVLIAIAIGCFALDRWRAASARASAEWRSTRQLAAGELPRRGLR